MRKPQDPIVFYSQVCSGAIIVASTALFWAMLILSAIR